MTEQTSWDRSRGWEEISARFGLRGLANPRRPVDLAAPQHGVDQPASSGVR